MKKLIFTLFLVIFLLFFSLSASGYYYVRMNDLNLSLYAPDTYMMISEDTPEDAYVFQWLGRSKYELLSDLKSKNIYLNLISDTYNEEIVVIQSKTYLEDFNQLSDTILKSFISSFVIDGYEKQNIEVLKYEVYRQPQTKFVKLYFYNSESYDYGLNYFTVVNGKMLHFTMHSYDGTILSRQESVMQTLVNSITFDSVAPPPEEGPDVPSSVYKDKAAHIKFTVPNNWEQKPPSQKWEYNDVEFVSTKEQGLSIFFGATDMWSLMPASTKVGLKREDINDLDLTWADDIAEMFDEISNDVSEKTFNNVHFYIVEKDGSTEVYGLNYSGTITAAIHFENGWMYCFAFSGTSDSPYYSSFEQTLESVKISWETSSIINWIALSSIIVVLAIAAVFIIRKRNFSNTAEASEPTFNFQSNASSTSNFSSNNGSRVCKGCGAVLNPNVHFCNKCGAKIENESSNKVASNTDISF